MPATAGPVSSRQGLERLARVLHGEPVSGDAALGGDPVASHLAALRALVADQPAAVSLVDGLSAWLAPKHPVARARRIRDYQDTPGGEQLPREVLYPPPNYTVAEVAERLRVSRWWVARRIQDGRIDAYKLGREYRIRQAELDRLEGGSA